MTNEEKLARIRPWMDPAERVTVHFRDARDLSAEITGCSEQLVDLSIQTHVPHIRQKVSVALSRTVVSDDASHYTRDPVRPLKQGRLMLFVDENRPPIIY